MFEEVEKGLEKEKSSSVPVKIIAGFISFMIGGILMQTTMYLVTIPISIVLAIIYSSSEAPDVAIKIGFIISLLFGLSILVASTVKLYRFLEKNLDFDFLP